MVETLQQPELQLVEEKIEVTMSMMLVLILVLMLVLVLMIIKITYFKVADELNLC